MYFYQEFKQMKTKQTGFTLVEIAIVLVIIGLLLGGVLKGQALVDSAKVKALANEMKAVQAAYNGYQDRFHAIPGDDIAAITHLGANVNGVAIVDSNGPLNGLIDGNGTWVGLTTVAVTANDHSLFWQHTRAAGLMAGNAAIGGATNAVGGSLGITSASPSNTLAGTRIICSGGIDGAIAQQLDTMLDDGVGTTGSAQARAGAAIAAAGAPAAYVNTNVYTVCTSF